MAKIVISDIPVEAIVGIYPEERTNPQPVLVSIEVEAHLTDAAMNCSVDRTIDYFVIAEAIKFIVREGKFSLIETASLAICNFLLEPVFDNDIQIVAAKVSIKKPNALSGMGIPSVEFSLKPDERISCNSETPRFGKKVFNCAEMQMLLVNEQTPTNAEASSNDRRDSHCVDFTIPGTNNRLWIERYAEPT